MAVQLREFARVRWAFTVALVALIAALVVSSVGVGAAPVTETPATANVQINVTTPTDDLEAGDIVSFNIASSNGVTLSGVEAKLCNVGPPPTLSPAFTSYDTNSYGFSGTNVRCVREVGIFQNGLDSDSVAGGIQAPTYRIDPKVQDPGATQSPTYDFVVGTGNVQWVNAGGNPGAMDCGADKPCAMVVKADHSGGTTYYIQQLVFAGGTVVTTTTPPTTTPGTTTPPTTAATTTTTSSTTTTTSGSTTSTTAPSSSSTTVAANPTGTTQTTTTIVVGGVSGSGTTPLAFTGTATRDLVSAALVLLAIGLFILGETQRRRSQS